MLSPFIGMSHFVWTAQIAVTLVALACGYYVGGRLADRAQRLGALYCAILAAAAFMTLTVLIIEPVAYWCLDFNLAVGSLLASTILFFIPLASLAMTAPFLVRVITSSVSGVGGNVGRLTAIGTFGSLGTLLIGYFMLPLLPNSISMGVTAGVLAGLRGYFLLRPARGAVTRSVRLAALLLANPVQRQYGSRNGSRAIPISAAPGVRPSTGVPLYLNDNLVQNTYDPVRKQSASTFTYMLPGWRGLTSRTSTTCSASAWAWASCRWTSPRRGRRVDVVEINPAVVPVAQRFFDLQTKG